MIAVVQRVSSAHLTVQEPPYYAAIQQGLCVLLGIEEGDTAAHASWMSKKLANLRIFQDQHDKMNRSIADINGEILLISQFTLAGDCTGGNRPSFIRAAKLEVAEPLVDEVGTMLAKVHGIPVSTGVFGASMQVQLTNEGPVTLIIQRD